VRLSKNVRRGLTYAIIVVAIVAGAELLLGSGFGSSPVYVVVSGSMIPTLQIGDLIVAHSVPFPSIHVGQVIIYVKPYSLGGCAGETIVHRVVAITSQGLVTQGDNRITNPNPDPWSPIPAVCVRGVVVLAVPYLGLISMVIPYPWNYALAGLILFSVFLAELRPSREQKEGAYRSSQDSYAEPDGVKRQ